MMCVSPTRTAIFLPNLAERGHHGDFSWFSWLLEGILVENEGQTTDDHIQYE